MGPTVTIRPTFSRWLAGALIASCLLVLGAAAVTGRLEEFLRTLVPTAGIATAAWAVLWRPLVEVSDGGVRVVNPLRTVHVPWPALTLVDTRWSLTLHTTTGGVVSAFAAPAPTALGEGGGRGRPGLSGEAARAVEKRRGELRDAGYLDDIRPEGAPVTVTWNVPVLALLGAAVAGTALLIAL